ncbi:MAG: ATP-binding protein [Clostridiales bacterium]|jgi:predicted AAA+ superfamily ATPase|nr:ATP-binding protein [Clostridiales bacterium]
MAPSIFQTGDDLLQLIASLTNESKFKRRDFVEPLIGFCTNNAFNSKLGIIFGLRSTGKTVGMLQAAEYLLQQGNKVGYARFNYQESRMSDAKAEIEALGTSGYTHLFIDEAPYLEGFMNRCAEWSDLLVPIYRLKIIITGTDSFLLWFAMHRGLYHRYECFLTNRNTFSESKRLLGQSYDEYKAHGGLLLAEGATVSELPLDKDAHIENFIHDAIVDNLIHSLEQCKEDYATGSHYLNRLYTIDKPVIFKCVIALLESTAELMIKKNLIASEQSDSGLGEIISEWSAHETSDDIKDRIVDQIEIFQKLIKLDNPKDSIIVLLEFLTNIGLFIETGSSFSDLSRMQITLCFAHPALLSYALDQAKNAIIQAVSVSDASAFSKSLAEASEEALNENIVNSHFIRLSDYDDNIFFYHDDKGREIDVVSVNRRLNRVRLVEVESKSKIDDRMVFKNEAKDLYVKEILKYIGVNKSFSITRIIAYKGENKRIANVKGDLFLLNIEDLLCRLKDLDAFIEEI